MSKPLDKFKDWVWDAAYSTTIEVPFPKEGTVMWISDIHFPYHDEKAVELTLKVQQALKPHTTHFGGDEFDFYQVSAFDKEPLRGTDSLQKEFDVGRYVFKEAIKWSPNVYKHIGNHEYRISKLITKAAPGLYGLRSLNLSEAAGLPKSIETVPYLAKIKQGPCHFTHGDTHSKSGNGVAAALSRKNPGISLVTGHNHKADYFIQVYRDVLCQYAVSGTLCKFEEARYVDSPNWTKGFIIVHYYLDKQKKQQIKIENCIITNNTVSVNGKTFKV